jgi:D-glycerate 3-kinase
MPKSDANTQPRALAQRLLEDCLPHLEGSRKPFLLGLSGLQGSGKSTVAAALVRQARRHGLAARTLSLDDVYLGRRARRRLAATVHPLLRTRGVPGTHDVALLTRTLDALAAASPRHPVALPRFDKGRDTRRPPSRWPRVHAPPDLVVLEGWCVGVPPQPARALRAPVNDLEREEDPEGRWRRYVNAALQDLAPIWARLDRLVVLQAPDWTAACRWREEAEQRLHAQHAPRAMSPAQLRRFMQHFERLSRHALAVLPARADRCLQLDAARRVVDTCRRRGRG